MQLILGTSAAQSTGPVSLLAFAEDRSTGGRKEYALAIARLAPTDYHRYHWPCDVTSWDIVREHQGKKEEGVFVLSYYNVIPLEVQSIT